MFVRIVTIPLLLVAAPWALGQDGSESKYEETMVKLLESMGQMTKTLEMVVDEATAKSKTAALKEHVEAFLKTRKQSQALAPPSAEVREKLAQKFRPEFEKSRKLLVEQIARVQRVPGGMGALQEIRAVFEKEGK